MPKLYVCVSQPHKNNKFSWPEFFSSIASPFGDSNTKSSDNLFAYKDFELTFTHPRGISSVGRALAWHARGQRFEPAILH